MKLSLTKIITTLGECALKNFVLAGFIKRQDGIRKVYRETHL